MRLVDYEATIKDEIRENRENPEIYKLLQKMIEAFLRKKKVCNCGADYKEMSYTIAGDLFLKIVNGEDIDYFLGYLEKVYRRYAHTYYEEHKPLAKGEYEGYIDAMEVLYGESSEAAYDRVISEVYLEDIGLVIDEVMRNSCKYDMRSSQFINLKLSLILSILRNEEVSFHLNKEQEFYLKLILINFHNTVKRDGYVSSGQ